MKDENELPFLIEEVEIKNLKSNKTPGYDNIINEQIKFGGEKLIKKLTEIFNKILEQGKIPEKWKKSDISLIFKKGDRHNINNYRPISLIPTLAKILPKLIDLRVRHNINEADSKEQAGFKKNFSTTDHLHTINLLLEKGKECQIPLHFVFIDYSKAFDSIEHNYLLEALRNHGLSNTLIQVIRDMYTNLKARVITDREGEYFEVKRGVKQGDSLSQYFSTWL